MLVFFSGLLASVFDPHKAMLARRPGTREKPTRRLTLELLEDRTVPSAGFGPGHVVLVVHPGESIQAAVNLAPAGAEIDVEPGVYAEAVTVAKPGIHLEGHRDRHGMGVTLVNPGGAPNGIFVSSTGAGFELSYFTVRGFGENGVILSGVDGFVLSHVTATDNGEYGLFPILSAHGIIADCTASGHRDTGIYVGLSTDVFIARSRAFANVVGFDVENSSHIRLIGNESYNNTAGILVTLLPGLQVKTASDVVVVGNFVHDNNHVNFGDPGDEVSALPPGIGILVLGVDQVTIVANVVTHNDSAGIVVGSSLLFGLFAGIPPAAFADIEPNADGVRVVGNWVKGNGHASALPFPGGDLLWDGTGTGNWWAGNQFDTSFPVALPRHP